VANVPYTQTITTWLNPANHSTPSAYTFGNCSITPGPRTPGIKNWDASLLKNFSVTEHDYFQFRAESFNLFNTPQFLGPNSVFWDSVILADQRAAGQPAGKSNLP
jgi:hypothetical protein